MNIVINYDFFNAIKDVNEGFTISKIARNCKNSWVKYNIPILAIAEYITFHEDFIKHMPEALVIQLGLIFGSNIAGYLTTGDIYKDKADYRLKTLLLQLRNLNIDTSMDLMKESICENRIYNLKFNKKNILQLIEYKYILVPTYNYQGDIVDTSIMQEHVVGSSKYILSQGSLKKVMKPVVVRA